MTRRLVGNAPTQDPDAATKEYVDDTTVPQPVGEPAGKIPIAQGDGTAVWADPLVQGVTAHDDAGGTTNPVATGGYAKDGAAPTSVNADGDIVRSWFRRTGAQVMELINSVLSVGGNVAHDDVDSGNPVKIGGKASTSVVPSNVANARRVDAWFGAKGQVVVGPGIPATPADGVSNTSIEGRFYAPDGSTVTGIGVLPRVYNGTTWDLIRGDVANGLDVDVTRVSGTVTVDTELPAAAALADAAANPTTPTAGAALLGYNGTTWDRIRTANTGRLQVDVLSGGGSPPSVTADDVAGSAVGSAGLQGFDGSTWDRIRLAEVLATASATPNDGLLAALAPDRRFTAQTLATGANSTQSWDVNGAGNLLVHVATTRTGTITFEVSADGTNWAAADVWDTVPNVWVTGTNLTPTANKVYRVHTTGWRLARARTVTTLSGTVALTATLAPDTSILSGVITAPPPHNIGYAMLAANARYTTTQTSANVIAGSAGLKIYVTKVTIATGGTTAGRVSLYWGTGTFAAATAVLWDGEFAPSATARPGSEPDYPIPVGGASNAADNLRITTDAAITVMVTVHYFRAA